MSLWKKALTSILPGISQSLKNTVQCRFLSATASILAKRGSEDPKKFLSYNDKIYPPQTPDEKPRNAFVCHQKTNIKYSPDKMWYVACLVRGMSVDEAVKQLSFVNKKGAIFVKQAILEAQKIAVEEHNVEYKSNLWVAESFTSKALVIKGIRRHARKRLGRVEYKYCHYFVRLEEGQPPEHYYSREKTPEELLEGWMEQMRRRKIPQAL